MTKRKSRVTVHSKLTIVSSRPIGPGKIHRLTALDHAMGLHTVHVVYYYRVNPFQNGPFESDLDNLRVSLSEFLCMYPPVTGRLGRGEDGNWEVRCNDAGVRMLSARVEATLDEWLQSADASDERDLTIWEDLPVDPTIWSPFRIQVFFCGGGEAIGLSCSNMDGDPTSVTMLIKSWSDIHRGLPTPPPLFHLPNCSRPPPQSTVEATSSYLSSKSTEQTSHLKLNTAAVTFRFSDSIIRQRLSEIQDFCPDATPSDLLAALFWICITRLRRPLVRKLSVCLDTRSLVPGKFSDRYFGNALHFSQLPLDDRVLAEGLLGRVAEMVHRHMARLGEGELWSTLDWFESRKDEKGRYAPPFRMYGPGLTCVCVEEVGDSGDRRLQAMFNEDERPVLVTCALDRNVEGEGLIVVVPSPEGGVSRTVTVTLPEEQTVKLCEDQVILGFGPILMPISRITLKIIFIFFHLNLFFLMCTGGHACS